MIQPKLISVLRITNFKKLYININQRKQTYFKTFILKNASV